MFRDAMCNLWGAVSSLTPQKTSPVPRRSPVASDFERLEERRLMAFVASINFTAPDAPAASAYVADVGQPYARRNGYTYGWTAANENFGYAQSRRTNQRASYSYNTISRGNNWEISVPNGLYNVYVSAGEPNRTGSSYRVNVEGMRAISGTPTDDQRFLGGLVTVRVADGKLTLSNIGRARDNRVNFINISDASPAGLTVKTVGESSVQLNWRDLTLYQAGIKIQRSTDGETFEQIADIPGGGAQSYVDNDVSTHTTYTYRVQNYTYLGDSNLSAPASIGIADVIVNVADYGARGDGITDDAPAIQAAFNAAPSGATVFLDPKATYLLGTGLSITKTLNLDGRGAKLVLNQSAYPQNTTIRVQSKIAAAVPFTEPIKAGQTTLRVATDVTKYRPGEFVHLGLGQDPYDANEQHFAALAKIVANDGKIITIDRAIPYDIIAGKFNNTVELVTRVVDGGSIKNVVFDWTTNTIVDQAIELSMVQNFTIEAISGRFSIGVLGADSRDVTIRNIRGTMEKNHSAAGRIVNLWQCDDVDISDVQVITSADASLFFVESHSRDTTISNVVINWNFKGTPGSNVFHLTGGSTGIEVSDVTIHNAGPLLVVDGGGQPADYHFSDITIDGEVKYLPLARFDNLRVGKNVYDAAHLKTLSIDIPILPNAKPNGATLFTGIIRSAKARLSNSQGVKQIFIVSSIGQGMEAAGLLKDGNLVTLGNLAGYGTDYPLAHPLNAIKNYQYFTDGTVVAGTILHLEFEYYAP